MPKSTVFLIFRGALKLLARHASVCINNNILHEQSLIRLMGIESLKTAISSIASLEDINSFLSEVARLSCGLCEYAVTTNQSTESTDESRKKHETSNEWPNLIAYVAEFNEIDKNKQDDQNKQHPYELNVQAAFPERFLNKLDEKFKDEKKKDKFGVSGLAIGINPLKANQDNDSRLQMPETKNIGDIKSCIAKGGEIGKVYIENNKKTNSQLSVPIVRHSNGEIYRIGVITLEHTNLNAFSPDIVNVIQQFAQSVAIAFFKQEQKTKLDEINKNLENTVENRNKSYKSLEAVVKKPTQSMLYEAIKATREDFQLDNIFIIMCETNSKNEFKILWETSEPTTVKEEFDGKKYKEHSNLNKNVTYQSIDYFTKSVFTNGESISIEAAQATNNDYAEQLEGFLFSSGNKKIGVVWTLKKSFSRKTNKNAPIIDFKLISNFFNIVALAYEITGKNNKLLSKSKDSVNQEISKDNDQVRTESSNYLKLALLTSGAGVVVFFIIAILMFIPPTPYRGKNANSLGMQSVNLPSETKSVGYLTLAGLGLQLLGILVFRRLKESNLRLDQYHKERFSIGQLEILLSAADQVGDSDLIKSIIIKDASSKWMDFSASSQLESPAMIQKDK
jgi:hypothetical protein